MVEKTLAIVKPDAVAAGHTGPIVQAIEQNGFVIMGMEKKQLTRADAQKFYAVHKERPFFGELVDFMISGPVVLMALQKEDAVAAWRDLMGPTDPAKAPEGTMRKRFGTNIGMNATHGSDSHDNALVEIGQFFPHLV